MAYIASLIVDRQVSASMVAAIDLTIALKGLTHRDCMKLIPELKAFPKRERVYTDHDAWGDYDF